jgi:lipid II:glycine glycyltransferase (peptidoglycan interpeptide bridge formation enzyme)
MSKYNNITLHEINYYQTLLTIYTTQTSIDKEEEMA